MIPGTAKPIQPPISAARRPFVGRKVLLVDPNPRDLEYYRSVLLGQGHGVRACAAYADGALLLHWDRFDLIMVSQGSCKFEGRLLVEQAVEIDRRMPVLVLTECLDMGCYIEAMQLGAADYVEKPLGMDDVVRLLETHVRRDDRMGRTAGAA